MPLWVVKRGVRAAVDRVYNIFVNGVLAASLPASPGFEEELALGFLASKCYDRSALEKAKIVVNGLDIYVSIESPPQGCKPITGGVIEKSKVLSYLDLLAKITYVPKKLSVGIHSGILVYRDGYIAVHDVSRHSVFRKLVGIAVKRHLDASNGLIASTCRVCGAMVRAASVIGVPVIVSWRDPLYSAIVEAERLGVTIVVVKKGEVRVPTHPERLN